MEAGRSEGAKPDSSEILTEKSFGGTMPPSPLIEFKNISQRFGSFYANRDISLSINEGEIHAIVGENGAGKTTLMNVLFGRLRPDAGSIFLRDARFRFALPGKPFAPVSEWSTRISSFSSALGARKHHPRLRKGSRAPDKKRRPGIILFCRIP